MSEEQVIREVENGVNSHQFLYQSLGETWRKTGEKQKASQKWICKALTFKWAQLGSNLDPLLKNAPVEHFKRGLDCSGGSRPDGATEARM